MLASHAFDSCARRSTLLQESARRNLFDRPVDLSTASAHGVSFTASQPSGGEAEPVDGCQAIDDHRVSTVWAVVLWQLRHGSFVPLRTVDNTMSVPSCQLATGQTASQAADRINQTQIGVVVDGWESVPLPDEAALMVTRVSEAPIELAAGSHWVDVDQLPLLSAFTPGFDLMTLYLALQQL